MSPTRAQIAFVMRHEPDKVLGRFGSGATWDFVDRCQQSGLIEIVEKPRSALTFPFGWAGTRLTPAGLALRDATRAKQQAKAGRK